MSRDAIRGFPAQTPGRLARRATSRPLSLCQIAGSWRRVPAASDWPLEPSCHFFLVDGFFVARFAVVFLAARFLVDRFLVVFLRVFFLAPDFFLALLFAVFFLAVFFLAPALFLVERLAVFFWVAFFFVLLFVFFLAAIFWLLNNEHPFRFVRCSPGRPRGKLLKPTPCQPRENRTSAETSARAAIAARTRPANSDGQA